MVSTPLLNHLRSQGHGLDTFKDKCNVTKTIPVIAFVDDADAVKKTDTSPTPLSRPQASLTTWSRNLNAKGGNLKWSKCFWQWLVHRWTGQCWKYQSIRETDHQLIITTTNSEQVVLERKEITSATLALGVMFSADGSI